MFWSMSEREMNSPIGAGPDHVIKKANQQTLAVGDGERVGVGG